MHVNDILSMIEKQREEVEKELLLNLDSDVQMVNEVAAYVFESGGKRKNPLSWSAIRRLCSRLWQTRRQISR
ncbi:MAG: hypothetical protein LRY50_11305 [Geovibrio sp.]|nr:hypothetical protein [Geovibrio sp.]